MIFEDIELEWEGVPYTISGDDRIMRVLAAVEEHITFLEVQQGMTSGKICFAKLATAYSVILRYAGCKVSSAEVYKGMWADLKTAQKATEAAAGILGMMVPPGIGGDDPEEPTADDKPKAKKKPSARSR